MAYCRPRKLILLSCLIILFYFGIKLWRSRSYEFSSYFGMVESSRTPYYFDNQENLKIETAVPWAPMFNHMYSCPICFGYGMCDEIMRGSILFHGELTMAQNTKILWKKGVLQTQRVLISSLIPEEWNKLDEFLCKNASQGVPCDLSSAIWKTSLAIEDLLSIEKFRDLNTLLDVPLTQLALPVCSSNKLLNEIIKSYDENFDGHFNREERILLLTSLIMQPSYVILKLQAKTRMTMPFPNLLGACGRSVILEGGLRPLKTYLTESFDSRAGLAIQVLQLVEDFEEEDSQWYFLYLGFSLDGIAVTKEGEVVVIDLDNIVIIDKSSSISGKQLAENGLCNEMCFQKITMHMFYSPYNSSVCSSISEYGQLMYAIVCKQVLSDVPEHREEGFFNYDGHRVHKKQEHPGLLHTIPYKAKEHIEDLLRECVQETRPNGRKNAVSELKTVLEDYVNTNDSGG